MAARRSMRLGTNPGKRTTYHYRLAAMAVGVGIAAAGGQHVAWADTGQTDTSHSTSSQSPAQSSAQGTRAEAKTGVSNRLKPLRRPSSTKKTSTAPDSVKAPTDSTPTPATAVPADDKTNSPVQQLNSVDPAPAAGDSKNLRPSWSRALKALPTTNEPATRASTAAIPVAAVAPTTIPAISTPTTSTAPTTGSSLSAVVSNPAGATSAPTVTGPLPPQPLSPLAKLLALPGQLINSVLQALDLTVATHGPQSPFDWNPLGQALFASFRRWEASMGFDQPPTPLPTMPTMTYSGDVTQKTPTVAQFLNASAAAYVLGGQPADLQPFVVNGFQLQSTNIFSGMSAKAWVTPDQQIIIAYQGTTGGTNLLFNPLIAISQLVADLQVMFTNTTPRAFVDSLNFAQKVQTEAAKQGYGAGDVFVTGHSLGGWEAQYVAQNTGLDGIGFEGPGMNSKVDGNGKNSGFVNIETYGDAAAYFSSDIPGLQPFMPANDATGGSKPHYGNIVMIGDPSAAYPMTNASALWGPNIFKALTFAWDVLGNFFQYHLPAVQAYHLGVTSDPGVVPWLGNSSGTVYDWGNLTIPLLQVAAQEANVLFAP